MSHTFWSAVWSVNADFFVKADGRNLDIQLT